MDIVEAITKRKSIRAFKPDPIPIDILQRLMGVTLRAPSWGNTQPWEFVIVSGKELDEIRTKFTENAEDALVPDINRPQQYPESYAARYRAMAAKFLEAKGIQREDRIGRGWWRLQGLKHFGAPTVIYICIDRSFYFQDTSINVWPIFDCGLVAQNIMLLALEYGLGTIPQAQSVVYPNILRRVLNLPESKLIVLGIAIGYPDWNDSINQFQSERESSDRIIQWYGF